MNNLEVHNIINVHYSLWSYKSSIEWNDRFYPAKLSVNSLYNSVLLPNKNGKKMLWITQPFQPNDSNDTYSSLQVKEELRKGNIMKITWIVDTYNSKFSYVGRVCTNYNSNTDKTSVTIEKYSDGIFQTIYTNQPLLSEDIYD
jgi:hypothetical protein